MTTRLMKKAALAAVLVSITGSANAQVSVGMLADDWAQAYNTRDRDALAAVYSADARLLMHGSPAIVGRDSIGEFWSADMQEGDPLTLLTVTNSVDGVDRLLVHGDYRVIDRVDGSQLGFGRFAHLWRRSDTRWELDRDLWNQPWEPYTEVAGSVDVQALAQRWTDAYNRHDRHALETVYDVNAELMVHGSAAIVGQGPIGDFWAEDFEEGNPITLLSVTHAVDGIDMVLVHGNYEVIHREDGGILGLGRFAHVWFENADGEWVLDRDIWIERSEPYEFN